MDRVHNNKQRIAHHRTCDEIFQAFFHFMYVCDKKLYREEPENEAIVLYHG